MVKVLDLLKQKISGPSFEEWFSDTTGFYDPKKSLFVIESSTILHHEWISHRYEKLIRTSITEITGEEKLNLVFSVRKDSSNHLH
uniref:DnaA N-terminal domain-containing protein n=1 Tax=Paenibacillus sp. FSL R7-0216 TaxID=2921677 RepID=UPI00403EFE4E